MGKKIQGKFITQAMNGKSVANRCNHQVLQIKFCLENRPTRKSHSVPRLNQMSEFPEILSHIFEIS